jgi:hypothetical protein
MQNTKQTLLIAVLFSTIGLCHAATVRATTITFSGLVGANGGVLAPYTESGFTVTPTVGTWFEAHAFGNPLPSIVAGGVFGGPTADAFSVTDAGKTFTFAQLDLAPSPIGTTSYTFIGTLSGATVFAVSAVLGAPQTFITIPSGVSGDVIDKLVVSTSLSDTSSNSSVNIDNIFVSATATPVPEPVTLALFGTGLVAIGARRWRNRRQRS